MFVYIDGSFVGYSAVTTNERDSHRAFVPRVVVVEGLPAGQHAIRLETRYQPACNTDSERVANYRTTTNSDDFFEASVGEIPDWDEAAGRVAQRESPGERA